MKQKRKSGRSRHVVGRTRERLAVMLERFGFTVHPDDLWWNDGYYGQRFLDCAKWGGDGLAGTQGRWPPDTRVTFSSWDTMTECVRYGIDLSDEDGQLFEVHAKAP